MHRRAQRLKHPRVLLDCRYQLLILPVRGLFMMKRFLSLEPFVLFDIENRRHGDKQTKHQQEHDLGHCQAKHHPVAVRR
jgi:hypothetical protein